MKIWKEELRDSDNRMVSFKIRLMGILEVENRENKGKIILGHIMANNSLELMNEMKSQIENKHRVSSRINQ